jgi:hypothetical protein
MKPLRLATWNFNTWIIRGRKKITNGQLWAWAKEHLVVDLVIFTEASTPPPADESADSSARALTPARSARDVISATTDMRGNL